MSNEQRVRDAQKALGKEADDYDIEYEDDPEESESGRPQLVLIGDAIDKNTLEKLKTAGFEFHSAQSADDDWDDDDEDEEEDDEDEDDSEDAEEETQAEIEAEEDDESYGMIEIFFEDMRAKARK